MAKIAIQGNPAGSGTFTLQPPDTNTNRTITLPDIDGTMAVAEQASVPIGSLLWVTGTSAPAGYVAANGQLLDRATYPALWAYANGSGNIVADVNWTDTKYSSGDGTTSFRVPNITSYDSQIACIRAYDILINPELLNAAGVVSQVNDLEVAKLDKSDNIVLGASVVASGTAVDFVGIPAGVKRITVMFDRVSTTGASPVQVQIGDSGGIENTGYLSGSNASGSTSSSSTTGLVLALITAADARIGAMILTNITLNTWVSTHSIVGTSILTNGVNGAGSKTLSGALDRIRITTVNGTDLFDAGIINISWEF